MGKQIIKEFLNSWKQGVIEIGKAYQEGADFKTLAGNAKVTLNVKRYPQQTSSQTALSPFTITSSTDKKDTRARGRFLNIKIENDAASESWRFGTLKLDLQQDGRR